MISLQITAEGGIQMLHDDLVDLRELGEIEVTRASHVEYADGKSYVPGAGGISWNVKPGWYVQSAKTLKVLADGFQTRAQALAWEKDYYSPTGMGWAELTQEVA